MATVFLIGYMACGKTTFGRALARAVGYDFVDLDFYIEQRFRRRIPEIFEERGEEGFRKLEAAMLREVGEFENVVIACGGGTPCFNNNMDYMLSKGATVWLQASVERIVDRLLKNRSRRPLMASKKPDELRSAVIKGLDTRNVHYDRAEIHFSGENLEDARQIDQTISRFLEIHHNIVD